MDNLLLHLIFLEMKNELEGRTFSSIHHPEEDTFLFYFHNEKMKKLLISARPGHPRIVLTRRYFSEGKHEPDPFGSLLKRSLEGLFLGTLEKEEEDRVIQLHFSSKRNKREPDFILMFEMIGRSSNLILTDGEQKVLGFARKLRSEFRQPIVGHSYQPPIRPPHSIFHVLKDPRLDESLSGSEEKLLGFLNETLMGAPGAVIRELLLRVRREGRLSSVLDDIKSDWGQMRTRSFLYAPSPIEAIGEDIRLNRDNFVLTAFAMETAGELVENGFDSLHEAADNYYATIIRNERFTSKKSLLLRLLKKEISRTEETLVKLRKDGEKFEDPKRFKRYGELLLAGMRSLKKAEDFLEVEDYYEQPGTRIRIPINPSLSISKNAEAYFQKFKKAERGVVVIEKRRNSLLARGLDLRALEGKVATCTDSGSLDSVMEKMRTLGLPVGIEDKVKRSVLSEEHLSGIRIYKSSNGLQILVGKSAKDNMKLTFKIASPEDFWLHAAGFGGAHVVVKNPSGMKRLPEKTLHEAARLAAFFSSGKEEGKVEVHYSKKKYVRRGKYLPVGTVLLKKYEIILIKAENPFAQN
ncbi:MAG: NFACT family protein [Acidobacteriota bacterium]